jgi:transcriptional regulator with XRE-family HTH domain|nr:MAG TPA: hypothetical protein [Caudoviricetes sp.]
MSLGQNIRLYRERLGISQEELAKKLGYKDRSTIAKIENNVNDITQSKIIAIAEALQTTPATLMGWNTEGKTLESDCCLTSEENALIHKYRCLDERGRAAVRNTLDHEFNSIAGETTNTPAKEA